MKKPNVLVIRTAGTNCDKETLYAFSESGADTTLLHINQVKENKDLSPYQIIALPGGFSYGDDLGAGKILSLELMLWFKDEIKKFIDKGGLMIGICNGFQVMVKTGILPDLDFQQKVTLTDNDSHRFEDRWVYLKTNKNNNSVWLKGLPEVISIPVAHGEGKFYTEKSVLDRIETNNQVAFRYSDRVGGSVDYPFNPNGSLNAIAGITDSTGKILGLMPHPERCMFEHHRPHWKEGDSTAFGKQIFENAVNYFK